MLCAPGQDHYGRVRPSSKLIVHAVVHLLTVHYPPPIGPEANLQLLRIWLLFPWSDEGTKRPIIAFMLTEHMCEAALVS